MINNDFFDGFWKSQIVTSTITPDNMPEEWLWAMDRLSWQNFQEFWS